MAHWFHRNPLKATSPLKFEGLLKCAKGEKCKEIITYVRFTTIKLQSSLGGEEFGGYL